MNGMCEMCTLFLADEQFEGCCSQTCLNDLYDYMADLAEFHQLQVSEL